MLLRVTSAQVNAYVWHRQHLAPSSRERAISAILRDGGPLRATPPLTPYLSLWARLEHLERRDLETALYESHTLLRVPGLQARLQILSAEDYPLYFQAAKLLGPTGAPSTLDDLLAPTPSGPEDGRSLRHADIVQRVLEVMNTRGPCTVAELSELLPMLRARVQAEGEPDEGAVVTLGARLIPALCAQGLLIRAEARGGWRSTSFSYATLSSWVPALRLDSIAPAAARQEVILRYIAAFGPVTVGDIAHWLGGAARHDIVAALMRLGDRLTHLEVEGSRGDYVMLKEQVAALVEERRCEHGVALLPPRDNLMMAYSDTSRFLAPHYGDHVFDRAGEAQGTVWVDGRIAGEWWLQLREERIVVRFFEAVPPDVLALAGEEARRLGRFMSFTAFDIEVGIYPDEDEETAPAAFPVIIQRR
jgi:hypothetical protein